MDAFYTKGGKEVTSINEMADALEVMPQDEFEHHVTPQRNDIAIWVDDVHKNEQLAKALSQTTDKDVMVKILKEVGAASFPHGEDYHQTSGAGKEDPDLHETYKKPEEWEAAKEAAHPGEDVENPATGEKSGIASIAEQYNDKDEVAEPAPINQGETPASEEEPAQAEVKPPEQPNEEIQHPAEKEDNPIPTDLNPGENSGKDKILFLIIGVIIGLILGYGIAWFLG